MQEETTFPANRCATAPATLTENHIISRQFQLPLCGSYLTEQHLSGCDEHSPLLHQMGRNRSKTDMTINQWIRIMLAGCLPLVRLHFNFGPAPPSLLLPGGALGERGRGCRDHLQMQKGRARWIPSPLVISGRLDFGNFQSSVGEFLVPGDPRSELPPIEIFSGLFYLFKLLRRNVMTFLVGIFLKTTSCFLVCNVETSSVFCRTGL